MPEAQSTHRIAIFRTGTHTAMSGASRAYTAADLIACAAAYDPAVFDAPVVVGHPETNAPAFGWVKGLALEGDTLFADLSGLDAAFVAAVNAGRYKKISAAFYLPDAPTNPAPGVLYLRHVGFLGGQAPAVKGLPAVSFSDAAYEEIDVYGDAASLIQFGQTALSQEKQSMSDDKKTGPTEQELAAFAQAKAERDALLAENAALKAESAQLIADALKRERQIRHDGNVTFADGLVAAGRVPSGVKPVLVAALDQLGEGATVSFGEGDGAKPLVAAFREALSGLPAMVDTKEKAGGAGAKSQMSRAEFEALPPEQRMAAAKSGVSLT